MKGKPGRIERYIDHLGAELEVDAELEAKLEAEGLLMEDCSLETVHKAPPRALFPSPYRPQRKTRADREARRNGRH